MKVELLVRLRGPDVELDEGVYDLSHPRAAYLRENLDPLLAGGTVKMVEDDPEPVIETAMVEPPEKVATTGRKRGRRPRKKVK